MKRRNLLLLLGGGGSAALSTGTGAFSSMEAERSVEVNVVSDSEAFVGYHTPNTDDGTVQNGDRITLVEIRNRFSEEATISLVGAKIDRGDRVLDSDSYRVERRVDDDPPEYESVEHADVVEAPETPDIDTVPTDGFGPGHYERITAEVEGIDPNEEVSIAVTVTVKGVAGTSVEAQLFGETRAFTLTGEDEVSASQTPTVDFKGSSDNAKLDGAESEVLTRVWYRDESEGEETLENREENLSNGQIRNQLFNGSEKSDKRIVAVSLTNLNRTYVREGDELNPGSSVCYEGVPGSEDEFDLDTLSACD